MTRKTYTELDMTTDNKIVNLKDPTANQDAATKKYVDDTTAPLSADFLVGTASGELSAEIVVGTTPGGELGGTWASPTVDATHAGSTHAATQAAAEATAAAALAAHNATQALLLHNIEALGDIPLGLAEL